MREILSTLCKYRKVKIIAGAVCLDHVQSKWDKAFWARGYYVSTVGNVNEETVRKYIQEQEENDK